MHRAETARLSMELQLLLLMLTEITHGPSKQGDGGRRQMRAQGEQRPVLRLERQNHPKDV